MKLLTIDIGNTNIKAGIFEDDSLTEIKVFPSTENFVREFLPPDLQRTVISSVVPNRLVEIKKLLKARYNIEPFVVSKESKLNLILEYETIDTLGIDRICSAEGAFYLYKKSDDYKNYNPNTYILSIDCGTATTINIVKYNCKFTGGVIAPGLDMMLSLPAEKTAQLPAVSLNDYKDLIGKNTKSSIASGVINSLAGLIEKTHAYLRNNMNADIIKIFMTGGNAELIRSHLNLETYFVKELVLLGLKSIYEANTQNE